MLVPAILYKEEIEKAFAKELYTERMYYYTGYSYENSIPVIKVQENIYQYAILNSAEELIGYFAYMVNPYLDCVYNFGLYSFEMNITVAKEVFEKLNELINTHHKVTWKMVGDNPIKKHYDKFCKEHDGNILVMHDETKDFNGNYTDVYIYEVVNEISKL